MVFEITLAVRYLASSRGQTALLVSGVSVGVVVFTFIAALMNGLGVRLVDDVTGNVSHITLEPLRRVPRTFMVPAASSALFAVEPGHEAKLIIRDYRSVLAIATAMRGVRVAVPEVFGSALLARGGKSLAVAVTGIEPDRADDIARLGPAMVRGRLDLGSGSVVVGSRLAEDLAVDVGDRVVLQVARPAGPDGAASAEAVVTIEGVFTLGVQAVDERAVYLNLGTARRLFDTSDGVSTVELKVDDVWQAPRIAERLARATNLRASSWLEKNASLEEGLRAQGSSTSLIKGFSLLTIAIGVSSALYLSVTRRRSEIGILRSFGIGRGSVLGAFILQGLLLGLAGALLGAGLGLGLAHLLQVVSVKPGGASSFPIDPARGEYLTAILLATAVSAAAAVLPAWSASNIDPLEAIQS
jgi:lipoprotein-releasing system permease protein